MLDKSSVLTANAEKLWPGEGKSLNSMSLEQDAHEPLIDAAPNDAQMVTVIIRTKNRPQALQNAIVSVANQTYRGIELCVINDGGSDVEEIVHAYASGSICQANYVLLQPGKGRAAAANTGLEHAQGDWLMFLDDDDSLDPSHLAELLTIARQEPFPRIVYSGVRGIDADGCEAFVWNAPYSAARMLWSNFIPIHAVLFQRSLVGKGLRFDTAFDIYEDWDFWTQLSRIANFARTNKITATYNLNGESGTWNQQQKQAEGRLQYYTKWLALLSAKELNDCFVEANMLEIKTGNLEEKVKILENESMKQKAQYSELILKDHESMKQKAKYLRDQADINRLEEKISQLETENAALMLKNRELELNSLPLTKYFRRVIQQLRSVKPLGKQSLFYFSRLCYRILPMPENIKQAMRQRVLTGVFSYPAHLINPGLQIVQEEFKPHVLNKDDARNEAYSALLNFMASGRKLHIPHVAAGSKPSVSIIVVLYNQVGLTLECLLALSQSQCVDIETIIIDNASTDETQQLMESVTGVHYVCNAENMHFLKAVNQAADFACGEYLLLLNNDAVLMPDAITQAVRRLESSSKIGAVGGKILLYDGSLQEAGSIVWQDGSCHGYGRGMDPEAAPFQFVRNVDYCSAAFLMTPRALFEKLERFDPVFEPAYYEETDYCLRLLEAGYDVVYDPKIRIRHFEFASSTSNHDALELQRRNRKSFVDKHRSFLSLQMEPSPANILMARQRLPEGRKRILVIDDSVPHVHRGSGFPRANLIMRLLAEQGHAVTLYPLQFPVDDWQAVYKSLPDTVEVMLGYGGEQLARFLEERHGYYDILLVSRPHNMEALQHLLTDNPDLLSRQGSTPVRLIYDAEAVYALREQLEAAVKGHPISEDVASAKLQAELSLVKGSDVVLAVSEAEAQYFRQTDCEQVLILGHSVNVEPSVNAFSARNRFLFVGAMHADTAPNADSICWFARKVWPLIKTRLGGIELDIVGLCHAHSVRSLEGNGIHVHGAVDALDSFFEMARVFVAPTRYAAGIPLKAQEAASRGVPMVVTSLIAQQLGWGDAVLSADTPADFAEQCIRLYTQQPLWLAQRNEALRLAQRDCSLEAFRSTLYSALNTVDLR